MPFNTNRSSTRNWQQGEVEKMSKCLKDEISPSLLKEKLTTAGSAEVV